MLSEHTPEKSIFHPERWGLPDEALDSLPGQLHQFLQRFKHCFRTKTHNRWLHAWTYLKGLLLLPLRRTFANIARRVLGIEHDGQNLQQFMSDSPWDEQRLFSQIQAEITAEPELHGGCLLLDDSGDACDGKHRAGASKQYIGRMGKQENGVVGVTLSYYHHGQRVWSMVDAELFVPERWFTEEYQELRQRSQLPPELTFQRKVELALQMVDRARERKLPFDFMCCDCLFGRDRSFRRELNSRDVVYMADTMGRNNVYLRKPKIRPLQRKRRTNAPPSKCRIEGKSRSIAWVARHAKLQWQDIFVRHSERGELHYRCAAKKVWLYHKGEVFQEWLFIWEKEDGTYRYSVSNAGPRTLLEKLAFLRAARYFVERDYQDAKSETGWDELEAQKYLAWKHHTGLCALALWFATWLKWEWKKKWPQDESLKGEFGIEQLPELSMANIRELLLAVMPLPPPTPKEAQQLVIQFLINRSLSTACRRRKQRALCQNNSQEFDDSS